MGQSPKISSRLSQDLINGALRDAYCKVTPLTVPVMETGAVMVAASAGLRMLSTGGTLRSGVTCTVMDSEWHARGIRGHGGQLPRALRGGSSTLLRQSR
jgi:hypothetical protein